MKNHVIKKDNKYIVFDPESLYLFSITENMGKILESYEFRSNSLPESLDSIEIDITKLLDSLNENVDCSICNCAEKVPKALCLIISHDCNLQCGYCYADHGTFGGEKKLMGFKTAKESIDKLFGEKCDNFILFFGGEPFINYPLMKDVVDYSNRNGLGISFTTITNGTIMSENIKEFIYKNFFALQISLDGPKAINDLQRYGSLESVHDRALETLDQLRSMGYPLSIKCIITKNSINKLNNIMGYLSTLGVGSIVFAEAALLPNDSEFYISDTEYMGCITELTHILVRNLDQLASGNNAPVIGPIFEILRSLTTKTRKANYCSAGRGYLAVTAEGDVYPCHGFVGMDEFKMGNVHDEDFPGESYASIRDFFSKLNVYTSKECSSCWARFLCGGDCAVYSYIYNKNLSKPTKRTVLSKFLPCL